MNDAEPSNVQPLLHDTGEPEALLRNALARCAEIRSRGFEPAVVVMTADRTEIPSLGASCTETQMAVFETRLRTAVDEAWHAADQRVG